MNAPVARAQSPVDVPASSLFGASAMGQAMRAFDWSATPLGAVPHWPQSLRTVVRLMLDSRFAMWLAWGPELTFFCNDAYRPTLGAKKGFIGAPASTVWAEIWGDVGPRIEHVLRDGEATWDEGLLLFLERRGYKEETYHSFSYSPVRGDSGRVEGMLCVVTEDTERTIGERRVAALGALSSTALTARNVQQAASAAVRAIAGNANDLPLALIYLFDEGGGEPRLVAETGLDASVERPHGADLWPHGALGADAEPVDVDDVVARIGRHPAGPWPEPVQRACLLPLARPGHEAGLAGFLVAGISPRQLFNASYRRYLALVADQVGNAISDARAFEQEHRRADALLELDRAKTAFFSNVSHELRTPLALIVQPIADLLARADRDEAERELLRLAERNGQRLQRLVNSLLDFSRIEAGRMPADPQPTDLAAFTADLASVFRSAIQRAGLELVVDCPPLPRPVGVDRAMWERVVFNLLGNALKYTFSGRIAISLRADSGEAVLEVADTGIGIAAAAQQRLFERFYRVEGALGRSIEGSGIGLAMVAELVRLHGGRVGVESREGAGSLFWVRVPMAEAPGASEVPVAAAPAASTVASAFLEQARDWLDDTGIGEFDEIGAGARDDGAPEASGTEGEAPDVGPAAPALALRPTILVADDNADMRRYLARLLGADYRVLSAADGAEALALARARRPDLVLSDVMMPRLDGYALLRALRAESETATLPLILLSAGAGEEARLKGIEAGADDYLVKPFSGRELLARVHGVIALARARAALALSGAALRDSEARLGLLVRLTEQTQALVDPTAILQAITRLVGEALGADRCLFADIDSQASAADVFGTWVRDADMERIEGRFALADFGVELVRLYRAGEPYVVDDIETDARLEGRRPAYRALKAIANLSVGVLNQGRLVAAMAAHQRTPRHWSAADVQLMQSVATHAWESLERARVQRALVTSEARLREMAEAMPQIVYVTGADGRIEFVNRQWRDFTGRAGADTEDLPAVVHGDDLAALEAAWREAAQSGEPMSAEFRLRRADGEYRWFLTRSVPVRDSAGRVVRWYGTSTNIDFQKRHAEALKRAQDALQRADRRKDEFLATLAHELRNPLAPLRNAVHLLQMSGNAEMLSRLQPLMRRQIDHLVRLVDDLLEVSRISSGKLELQRAPLVLSVVLASALEASRPFLDAAGHDLQADIGGEELLVDGDAVRLTQVFVNLLNNAAKYSERQRRIRFAARREGSEAVVEVQDQGVGMAAELVPRVFDLFVQGEDAAQRSQGGLGIGLSLVRSLLALHGASIEAMSEGVGRGSTFVVRLPLLPAGASARAAPPARPAGMSVARKDALRVLVCDDNRDAACTLGHLLELMGAAVSIVHDGAAAIDKARAERPELVLLDLGMPEMDGFEVARRLRALPAGGALQVVALTGWGQQRDRERTRAAGFDGHLVKPVDMLELQTLLAALAERARVTTTTTGEKAS